MSAAAIFLDACLENARAGTRVLAILPDVLRSGERYKAWRSHVETRAKLGRVELIGQFDQWADVDVFSLELEVSRPGGEGTASWGYPLADTTRTVGDHFLVSVGRVVPHRDAEVGPCYRYIHARGLPPWEVDSEPKECRRFSGRPFLPPFVAVRRTSRMGHPYRAVGTVVTGDEPVAVENHLIILTPIDGTVDECRALLSVLRSPRTNEWFDQRTRCRHLTALTVRQLPWWEAGP